MPGPGSARESTRRLMGPCFTPLARTRMRRLPPFLRTPPPASRTWRKGPLGTHPRVGSTEMDVTRGGDSPRLRYDGPAAVGSRAPVGFLVGGGGSDRRIRARQPRRIRGRPPDFALPANPINTHHPHSRPPPILRIAKGPDFRGIVTDRRSPCRQMQWGINVHVSKLLSWRLKMGRGMRPLSAAPHHARRGLMGEESP